MQKRLLPIALLLITYTTQASDINEQPDPRIIEARTIAKEFATDLMGRLKAAMNTGGPRKAIQTCKLAAPEVASKLSSKHKWQIGRTSLKTRNPANAPDSWEEKVLKNFEKRKQQGETISSLEFTEAVGTEENQLFRYMKAIPTKGLCLTCHGTELSESVKETLAELYPHDTARDFKAGDIRGAFTLSLTRGPK